jgi:hypothetical protein
MMQGILEEAIGLELQHINVKLLLESPEQLDLDAVVNVFHSWIQGQVCEELLLDVADYRHVYHGPGIVLIGHEADYSLDNTDGQLGLRYNRKARLEGSNLDSLVHATRAALTAASRLQADTRLNGKCNFNGQSVQIFINDRGLAPNLVETRQAIVAELRRFLGSLFGEVGYSLTFEPSARRLFGATINASRPVRISDLLANLEASYRSSHGVA